MRLHPRRLSLGPLRLVRLTTGGWVAGWRTRKFGHADRAVAAAWRAVTRCPCKDGHAGGCERASS